MAVHDDIIQAIYEAAAVPELWPKVLEQLGRTVNTPGLVLLTRRSDSWTGYQVSKSLEADFLEYYASDIATRSETTKRLLAADHAGFLSDDDLFQPHEWEIEPFRREWGCRWGWNHAAATAVSVPSGDFLVFHAQRRESESSFSPADIAVLDGFRPHLARAALLAARWRMQRLRVATEALALVGLPAAVVDRDSRLLAANSLIEEMTKHVRWLPSDRLALADDQANEILHQALARLFDRTGSVVQSFASRVAADDAAVVHVIPTAGQSRDIFDGGLALLVLTPISEPDAPEASLIRALFDLSPAEARVARSVVRGATAKQIAVASGVSQETVRTQLKAIMMKTGTRRQAEVVTLLGGLQKIPFKR